jgi:predicted membrane-bound mannosyltransferase
LLVSFTLFSSFFTHWRGPLDSFLTYTHYLTRAEGAGSAAMHDKPWYYYLVLLAYTYRQAGPRWTEAFTLLLALIGLGVVLWPRITVDEEHARAQQFRRFLAFYAVLILVLYSAVPYKTPWNLLVFYHAAALLAGIGASAVLYTGRWYFMQLGLVIALLAGNFLILGGIGANAIAHVGRRTVQVLLCLLLLVGTAHMGYQSYQGNFIYPADARNPYVYAHPSTAIRRIITRIEDITAVADESYALHINIIRPDGDYWPLPWYLRKYTKVGWWRGMPDHPDAAIILASPELHDLLQERLKDDYMVEFHALRPGFLLHAYIRRDLWNAFMQTRQ